MVDEFHLHLAYEIVVSIFHQGTDPWVVVFFMGPYIIFLVPKMGILEGTHRIRIVGKVPRITLRPSGLLVWCGTLAQLGV